jgi:hypothetical protein
MKSLRRRLAAIAALLVTAPALAHHSVAMYDNDNLIKIAGTVTRVEWTSPHAFVYLETKGDDGKAVEWAIELDPPVLLKRYGWRQSTVKAGDTIGFTGAPAKSGAPLMRGAILELADGTELRVWSRV